MQQIRRSGRRAALALVLTLSAMPIAPAAAQSAPDLSRPAASAPMPPAIPAARDEPWPGGTIRLEVDATDIQRRIVRVRETIPLARGGPLTLMLPEWLPGNHGPRGEIEKLAGLRFSADGRDIAWTRDPVNVFAFHLILPDDARAVTAQFDYLAATEADQGRAKMTSAIMNLQWENLSLYPAGHYVRRIPVQASVTYPRPGWTDAGALLGKRDGATVDYETTDYETLIDSPVFAGINTASWDLGNGVALNVFADDPAELVATPAQIAAHRKLVNEAITLFGARPFDRYAFLLAITSELGRIGLEHHRSSENTVRPGYFRQWGVGPADRNILPHELTHSWIGKYRRPADMWTPDYAQPMRGGLLWVYEGQTQFWGYVLGARSGIYTKDQTLDALAVIAARLDLNNGRTWRPFADTTRDPIIAARRPKAWPDWQRSEDYYNEGLMVWLEADAIIRRGTRGARGLDDFAGAFFRPRDGDWGSVPYDRAEVVAALNAVFPYDWEAFFQSRIDGLQPSVTKAGLTLGGYRLDWSETPNSVTRGRETEGKLIDQSYGIGLVVKDDGMIDQVIWNSAAFRAGLTTGDRIVAVNDIEYARTGFIEALAAGRKGKAPLRLLTRRGRAFTTITLDYSGGLRYPRLQKTSETEGSLDRLLKPRT